MIKHEMLWRTAINSKKKQSELKNYFNYVTNQPCVYMIIKFIERRI